MCAEHPHAQTLPNSSLYYMRLDIDGKPAGLAAWGYGVTPAFTPKHLFGDAGRVEDYLELCRFFVFDWCPKNTASRFLSTTHRLLKKYVPRVKWLYTYAAGFQGLIGYIYQAAGYDYIGRQLTNAFLYIEGVGLVHRISLYERYHKGTTNPNEWQGIFPGSRQWCGYNFRYLYWLCDANEKTRLMQSANFEIVKPYPSETDLEMWLIGADGTKTPLTKEFAKSIPIVKLRTMRGRAERETGGVSNSDTGGANPTLPLSESQLVNDGKAQNTE